ncbi:MAG: DMT family transporter [Oricola sp.]
MALSANLRASIFMAASMAGFTANDALTKSLGGEVNAGQIMLVRGALMFLFLALYMRLAGTHVPLRRSLSGAMALRIAGEVLGTVFFLFALFQMPIANISAILQALPLAVTLGAAIVLRETVGIRRLSAVLIGFIGVVIIIRPGVEGFNIYSLSALVTVVFAATRDLATRKLSHDIPALAVTLLTTAAVSLSGLVMMAFMGGWQPMSLKAVAILGVATVFLFVGYQCLVLAMRSGDIHVVAPFRYTSLLWSIIFGMVFFGEWPDGFTILGSAIIVATGLYTLYRERIVQRRAASANISAVSPPPARGT